MAAAHAGRRFRAAALFGLLAGTAGCISVNQRDVPAWQPIPEPPQSEIEHVVFIMGDGGESNYANSPTLHLLRDDIDQWAGRIARDSGVILLVLGDNIYPIGLHPRGHPQFVSDSIHLHDQARLVGGANARRYNTPALFLPGNHDWAIEGGVEGEARLRHQGELLTAFRQQGFNARLLPPAATPGPGVVDIGRRLRMVLLDTAWWVLSPSTGLKAGLLIRIEEALRTRGDRTVIMAAHHPFESGGAHGEGMVPVWKTLGIKYFLARSGALLQNLRSLPLNDLRLRLLDIFQRNGAPLIFAGGHEHSLQVLERTDPREPHWGLVAGSMSKLTHVGWVEGQRYRASLPGYMRVMILRDGSAAVFVVGLGREYVQCGHTVAEQRAQCIAEGIASAKVIYSGALRYKD